LESILAHKVQVLLPFVMSFVVQFMELEPEPGWEKSKVWC